MMEKKVHRQLLDDALKALCEQRLNDAHIIIRTLCKECGDTDITNRFESIESDYYAMLDFMSRGGDDEHKEENFEQLIRRTFHLLASLEYELIFVQYESELPSDVVDIVSAYWTNNPKAMSNLLDAPLYDDYVSLTGIILSIMVHPEVLNFSPELRERVKALMQDDSLQQVIFFIYTEIFLSSQAERIEQHMKDEMMPMMLEAAKDKRLQQEMTEEMTGDEDEMDSFEKLMKQRELEPLTPDQRRKKKQLNAAMSELMDIHNEGIDINTEIFDFAARLPFFSKIGNWFLPFDPHNPAVEPICYPNGKPNILFRMLYDVPSICDIDKYAMTFIMAKRFKSDKVNMMITDLQNIIAESESLKGIDFVLPEKSQKAQVTDFIHAFYRFVTKSQWKNEFTNVFADQLPFSTNPILSIPLRRSMEQAMELADKMWKFGAKSEAVKIYLFLEKEGVKLDITHCLKIALYSEEILPFDDDCDLDGDSYVNKAFEMDPTDRDVLFAVAHMYASNGDYIKRLKILRTLTDLYPDDIDGIIELIKTHEILWNFEEANQLCFKLEYMEKKVKFALRGIVQNSLYLKKYDVALRYSRKIFNTPGMATWMDYLRGGHAAWLNNDMTSALTFYHLYIKHYLTDDPSITDALEPFNADVSTLQALGKTNTEISLMRDMITLKAI